MSGAFDFHTMIHNTANIPVPSDSGLLLCESAGKMLNMSDVKPYFPEAVLAAATSAKAKFGSSQAGRGGLSKYRLVCIKSVLDNEEHEPIHATNITSESSGEWEDITDEAERLPAISKGGSEKSYNSYPLGSRYV